MNASQEAVHQLPEGTYAVRKTGGQEQSRRDETPDPPERASVKGRSRFQHSHDDRMDTGILAKRPVIVRIHNEDDEDVRDT